MSEDLRLRRGTKELKTWNEAISCAKKDFPDKLKELSEMGVDVLNATNQEGETLLNKVILKGSRGKCKYLLTMGADPNKRVLPPAKGYTEGIYPLVSAFLSDGGVVTRIRIMEDLLAAGADLHAERDGNNMIMWATGWGDQVMLKFFMKKGLDINKAGREGETPLMRAVRGGSVNMVKFLVENGARLDTRDDYGNRAEDISEKTHFSPKQIEEGAGNLSGYLRAEREIREMEGAAEKGSKRKRKNKL